MQEEIKALQNHIIQVQDREVVEMYNFTAHLEEYGNLKKEQDERKKHKETLQDIRYERKRYRAMLYDAIKERDNLIASREIAKHEERIAKNRVKYSLSLSLSLSLSRSSISFSYIYHTKRFI